MLVYPMSFIKDKNIQALFVIYLLSNLLLLLNINGIYWDDWVIFDQSFDEIKTMSNQLTGNTHLFEYIFWSLSHIGNGVLSYRVTTFVVYFLSGLFLFYILLSIKSISKQSAFYITLLFLILPVNSARIGLCVTHYGLFLCLFFLAFWLLTQYMNKQGGIFFRILILGLFYLSFFVSSLIVFYAVVLLYTLYIIQINSTSKSYASSLKILFVRYPDFICLPILFFYIKTNYFVPYGLYENYNAISWDYFKQHIIENIQLSFKHAFYKPLSQAFIVVQRFWLLSLAAMGFLFLYLQKNRSTPSNNDGRLTFITLMMCLGLLFFVLAIFPYAAIGKVPSLFYFSSRHMLLVPLGLSLCLYSGILLIERKNRVLGQFVLIALLASCVIKNVHDQALYLKDWFYQVALEEHYKENTAIREHSTFFFRTNIPFANSRSMQFYEHNGRLRKVFGNDQRFMGDNLREINTYADHKPYKRYNFSTWTLSSPVIVNVQAEPSHSITNNSFLKLLVCMLTDEAIFRYEAKQLITLWTSDKKTDGQFYETV